MPIPYERALPSALVHDREARVEAHKHMNAIYEHKKRWYGSVGGGVYMVFVGHLWPVGRYKKTSRKALTMKASRE